MVYLTMQDNIASKDFFLSLLRNVPYGVVAINHNGTIRMINEKARKAFSIKEKGVNLVGTSFIPKIKNLKKLKSRIMKFVDKGEKDFRIKAVLFKGKYLNINGTAIPDGLLISVNDITEAKKGQNMATLSLLKGQEMERRRLAQEIHDGIGPMLSTIRLHLDTVKGELPEELPAKTAAKIKNMSEMIQEVATDIRAVSHALMPGALIDFGLVKALENICLKFSQKGKMDIDFFHSGMTKRLSTKMEFNLYRVAQELLNNALKYSEATHVDVQLICRSTELLLMVEDNGKGFSPEDLIEKMENGIGLRNIKTRVTSLGGDFSIETELERGVQAIIEIPLVVQNNSIV